MAVCDTEISLKLCSEIQSYADYSSLAHIFLLMDELFTVYQKSRCGVCSCLSSGHTYCSSVIL